MGRCLGTECLWQRGAAIGLCERDTLYELAVRLKAAATSRLREYNVWGSNEGFLQEVKCGRKTDQGRSASRQGKKLSKRTTKGKAAEAEASFGKSLEWRNQQEILKLFGTIEYYEKYDYKRERRRKR